MNTIWITIAALCVGTIALKAAGPLALRGHQPPQQAMMIIALVAPAVLTSLVLYQTLAATPSGITFDARITGLTAAAIAITARAPMFIVVLLAALTTAATRAFLP